MKKVVLIIMFVLLVGCTNKRPLQFEEISDRSYINSYKDSLISVTVIKISEGNKLCYSVDTENAYKAINDLKIVKESKISVTDDNTFYIFEFENDKKIKFTFEGEYLRYQNKNYIVSNFSNVELLEENLIKCE